MEELIKKATKALNENLGFNEITLNDGVSTVHLVRYTPAPTQLMPAPNYWGYNPYQPIPQP